MRFTVFSNDAKISKSNVNGNNRPRKFEWNLNVGSVVKYKKIAIESIFCRNKRAVIQTNVSGLVMDYEMLYTGNKESDTYLKNSMYKTTTNGTGVNLFIQNRRHHNAGGDITKLAIVNRGSGYKVGDMVTVLDVNEMLPPLNNRATFQVTSVNDGKYDHDLTSYDVTGDMQLQRMIGLGNCDEKELFSIRFPSFGNHYDTRDSSFKNGGSIFYMGPLKLQNTNPQNAYSYDLKSTDFLNGSFELSIDSNFGNENGISPDIIFGVSFVLLE
jgi:hypothetical protein